MSVKQYKFVSPGIFINEIDNSFTPEDATKTGPVVIGRTKRGPGMRPLKVQSMSEFVNIFGDPVPGGEGTDVWRYGNYTAPTYAAYAAQAYLRNSGPLTVVRLLGDANPQATDLSGLAGWQTTNGYGTGENSGGAFGLFMFPSGSDEYMSNGDTTGTLGAVWYCNEGGIALSGTTSSSLGIVATSSTGDAIVSIGSEGATWKAVVYGGTSDNLHTTELILTAHQINIFERFSIPIPLSPMSALKLLRLLTGWENLTGTGLETPTLVMILLLRLPTIMGLFYPCVNPTPQLTFR